MSSSCSSGSIAYRSYDDSDTEGEAVNNSDSYKNEAQQEAIPAETGNDMAALSQPKAQEIGNEEAAIEGVDEVPAVTQASRGAPRKRNRKATSGTTGTGNSRLKSEVWNHFERYKKELFTVKDGKKIPSGHDWRARCIHCGTDFRANSSFSGTSTLGRHIKNVCKKYPGREVVDEGQQNLVGDGGQDEKLTQQLPWSNDRCIRAACEMIVIDELPFSHVEKEGFRHFCKVAIPKFIPPSRRTIVRNFWELYEEKKLELKKVLSSHTVCLTTDTWTSVQNINYMVLTAHFIDDSWTLHKRIINFCVIPNHKGTTIGKILETCLLRWKVGKVLTISVDNASANKVAIKYIVKKMMGWENPLVFDGMYVHVRCWVHILNIIVRAGLIIMDKSVAAIRNAVKYVRSSSNRKDCFLDCIEKETLLGTIESKRIPALDISTRWNSTFLMLDIALEVRPAFDKMADEEQSKYKDYFKEEEEDDEEEDGAENCEVQVQSKQKRIRVGPPKAEDWEKAEVFVKFLRVFYDVTMRLSLQKHPTAHKAFHDIVAIQCEIDSLFVEQELVDRTATQALMKEMAGKMREKFRKYFGRVEDMNQLFLVALVLDPRFKLKNIGHVCSTELGYGAYEAKVKVSEVKELLVKLTDLYRTSNTSSSSKSTSKSSNTASLVSGSTKETATSSHSKHVKVKPAGKMADMLNSWQKALAESDEVIVESEVDRYLLDPIECPPNVCLLKWWKLNGYKYPNIALVAKDILAIQVSTVASESSFSTGGRVIDPFRSSLSPKTVEALICLQNWIAKKNQSEIEFYPSQEEIEFYEKMEKDAAKQKAKKKAEKGKGKQQILVESEDEAPVEIVAAKPTKRMKGNTSGKENSVGPVAVPSAPIVNDVGTSQNEPPRVMKMMLASKKSKGRR